MAEAQVWEVAPDAPVYVRRGVKTIDATPPWANYRRAGSFWVGETMTPIQFNDLRVKTVKDWDADLRNGEVTINDYRRDLGFTPYDLIDPATLRIQVPRSDHKA